MATIKSPKCINGFKDTDHQSLVIIVKAAQVNQVKGKRGNWNDFVANVNKKRGGTHSDPAKHPVDVLATFVQTFSKKEDVEELVEFTQHHPRFGSLYKFQSWMEGWKHSRRGDPDSSVQFISLDCEMVVCEGGVKELVRVCAMGSDYKDPS